jgi:probable rRNA maturation factor
MGEYNFMIDINNLTHFVVDKKFFLGVAKKVLKGENRGTESLSIAFVSPAEIQKLNKKYRKKDKPTDVLSFERVSHFKEEPLEVILCPEIIRENAKESKLSLKKEMANMLVHGILHTFGYDHERSEKDAVEMEKKQAYYFSKV